MPHPAPIPLAMPAKYQAETLLLEGPDAIAFAQSQFSSDVTGLAVGRWQFSAWLDAQGRVRALFHLARLNDQSLLLVLRGGHAEALADGLRRFVFRSKVKVAPLPTRAVGSSNAMEMFTVVQTDHDVVLGFGTHAWTIGKREDDAWRAEQIRLGWPWLPDEALDSLLPPALSLERLQAVAFDKGCYPGQEITARLHFRGGHKRHMHSVVLSSYVEPGTMLRAGQSDAALVLDCVRSEQENIALAVIGDAVSEDKQTIALSLDGEVVHVSLRERWPE